jgi:tetratricopeptide (TPR) repeat protein
MILAAFGVLLIAVAVYERRGEDPLAAIFDLQGVPVSPELVDYLAAGRISLSDPEPANTVTRLLDRAQELAVAIQRPESRSRAIDELWAAWRNDPTNFVWMDLATRYRHHVTRPDPFADMLRHPALSDSAGAAGAYLRGRLSYAYRERSNFFRAAESASSELDSLQQVMLTLNLAYQERSEIGSLAAAERLLSCLSLARRTGGCRLEAKCWSGIAAYLQSSDRLDDALHAAVLAAGMAHKIDNPNLFIKRRILIAEIMHDRREHFGALDLLETCLSDAEACDYTWGITFGLDQAASICCHLLDYERAIAYDQRNLAHSVAAADSQNVPRNLASLSYDFRMLGSLDSCRVYIERARHWVDIFPDPMNTPMMPLFEAEYFCQVGDYEAVEPLLAEARALMWDASQAEDVADMLIDHIRMGLEMGHVDLAYRSIAQLRTMPEALRDRLPNQNRLADFEILSADLLAGQGEFRQAEAAQSRARAAVLQRGDDGKLWECCRSEGELSMLRGDLAAARAAFAECLTLAEAEGNPTRLASSRCLLGQALLELGDFSAARDLFSDDKAEVSYGGRFRTRLSSSLLLGMSYSREGRHPVAIEQFRRLLEQCTENTPGDLMARLRIELARSLVQCGEFEEAERSLLLAMDLLQTTGGHTQIEELRAFNQVALRDASETLIGLYVDRPDLLAGLDPNEHTLLLAERSRWSSDRSATAEPVASSEMLARLLTEDSPLLAFFVGGERSFVWAGVDGVLTVDALPGREPLLRALAPVTADLERPGRPLDKDAASRLSSLLMGALDDRWPAGSTLRIIPDDILFAVPWSALPFSEAGSGGAPRPIIEHGPICEAPSLAMLIRTDAPAPAGSLRMLAIGQDGAADRDRPSGGLRPLRHAEAEAQSICALWPAGLAVAWTGDDAWKRLSAPRRDRYDVLHIASHAVVHQGAPGRSTLRLASGPDPIPVTIAAVVELELDAELVFLSCCEAAGRSAGRGRGLADFARAFMRAGAKTVVASSLRIDDEAAAFLAARFYRHWLDGGSKAQALRAAQLDLRASRAAWDHPYYWASFRLLGDGS